MSKRKTSTSSVVFAVVFLSWFVLSIAALLVTAKVQELGWTAVVFGQYFIVFGVAGFRNEMKVGFRHPIVLVLPMVGFAVVICGFLFQFGSDAVKKNVVWHIPNMAAGLFCVVGILLLIQNLLEKSEQKKCTYAVQGKCVEVKWQYSNSSGGGSTKAYCPVYEYYYNGQAYTGSQEIYVKHRHVAEGEYREIFINPNKPTVFFEEGVSRLYGTLLLMIGAVFLASGGIIIYAYNFM